MATGVTPRSVSHWRSRTNSDVIVVQVRHALCRWPLAFATMAHPTTDSSLVDIESCTRLLHHGQCITPRHHWAGDGMPTPDTFSLACFPVRERQSVVLVGHPGSHGWSGSQREDQTDLLRDTRPACILPFFMRGGASVMPDSLVANSDGER